ncbi:MAG TPA: helix-turn-helix transcriptional regulator [Solirubrobacterales bacterium]|nr:helix-turn-helix transcriptional regulator [Solirubrobacterales bacterium]
MRNAEVARRIGHNVLLARRRAGYSQEGLAKRCSLHRTEIGLIESGGRLPRADTLMKLAGGLEVGAELLLRGIEWIPSSSSAGGSFGIISPGLRGG